MDFYRSSIRDAQLLDAASPLPLLSRVLKEAAELVDKQPPEDDPDRGEALRLAVTQFAEKILFVDHANYYRILGLNRDADTVLIKDHYKWLSRLLFPVADMVHWNESNGVLLNRAYSVLRDPKFRKAYTEEFLSKSSIDKTLGVKREAAVRTGGGQGQGAAAEAVASVPGQAQFPAEENSSPEQASVHPGRNSEEPSFIETNIHRLNPTPFAKAKPDRFPVDLMSAAAVSAGPAPTAIPVNNGGAFPPPTETGQAARGSWGSLAAKIGLPIIVGLGVFVYLSDIPLPFIDHRDRHRPEPVTINSPAAAVGDGQLIARSEPPIQVSTGGQKTEDEPSHDAASDLNARTNEPVTITFNDEKPSSAAVTDKQIVPVQPLSSGKPAGQIPTSSVPGDGSSMGAGQTNPASPLHHATEQVHAKTIHPKQAIKPAASSTPPPVISAVKRPPPPLPVHRPLTAQSKPASPLHAVTEQAQTKIARIEQVPTPAAPPAPPPTPVESAGEQPPSRPMDLSVHPDSAAVPDKEVVSVQPPLSGDKLAIAAAQMLPPPLPGSSSSTGQSNPASPLQAVTEHQLESLVKTFISSYEAGDMDIFMSLLSDDAHTKSQKDRDSIRTAYDQLFLATRNRRLKLSGIKWVHAADGTMVGRAPFLLTLNQEGKRDPLQYRGTMIFQVENRSTHLLIKQFDYEYKGKKD